MQAEHEFRYQAFYHLQAEEFLRLHKEYMENTDHTVEFGEYLKQRKADQCSPK